MSISTEAIWQEILLCWEKLKYFAAVLYDLARGVVAEPGSIARGDLILMGAAAPIVALFLLGGLIRFITEPWKKKGEALLTMLIFLIVLAVILFFVLRAIEIPGF